jgi:Tat protein translocase TatB subunit
MPQIGSLEILVVAAIALIVFGPDKLPGIAGSIGRAAAELRRMATEVTDEFKSGLDDEDERNQARSRNEPATTEPDKDPKTGPSGGES